MKGICKGSVLLGSLTLLLMLGVVLVGCDSSVHIQFFESSLDRVIPAGSNYSRSGDTCSFNSREVDLDLAVTVTRAEQEGGTRQRLVRPGDILSQCTLQPGELPDTPGEFCYLGSQDFTFSNTKVQLLGNSQSDPHSCTDGCPDGWTCNDNANVNRCERDISLSIPQGRDSAPNPAFMPTGVLGRPRLVALVIDHGISLFTPVAGQNVQATDPSRDRLAAASDFVKTLGSEDRASVFSYNAIGVSSVRGETLDETNQIDFIAADTVVNDRLVLEEQINSLFSGAGVTSESHTWDPIVRAAEELRFYMEANSDTDFNPMIVLFTDGPHPDRSATDLGEARSALLGEEPSIPLFLVHLDNVQVMGTNASGRYADFQRLTCETNGMYFYITRPDHLGYTFSQVLPHLTVGRWRLKVSYEELSTGTYSAGRYGIYSALGVRIDGVEKVGPVGGAQFPGGGGVRRDFLDTTIIVEKR